MIAAADQGAAADCNKSRRAVVVAVNGLGGGRDDIGVSADIHMAVADEDGVRAARRRLNRRAAIDIDHHTGLSRPVDPRRIRAARDRARNRLARSRRVVIAIGESRRGGEKNKPGQGRGSKQMTFHKSP